jgi:hypothetical protein
MAYYTVTDGTTVRNVFDIEISEATNELDQCVIMTDGKYTDNVALIIKDETDTPIFYGFQKTSEQRDDYNVMYDLTLMEKAVEMQYVILDNSGATTFVKTDTADNLIAWAIGKVNTAYGYTGGDAWTVDSGSAGVSTSLSIGCYYTNALAFLRKVVVDNLGLLMWFDSSAKKIYYKALNHDTTAKVMPCITKTEQRDSNKRGCDKVIIVGKTDLITGSAGTGNLIRAFSYPTAATVAECNNLAALLLADLSATNVKYEATLDEEEMVIDSLTCEVGDYISISAGVTCIVTNMITTFDKRVITTGGTTTAVLDMLGSSITEISGETLTGSQVVWNGGEQQVGASASGKWTLNLTDADLVTDFKLNVKLKKLTRMAADDEKKSGCGVGAVGTGLSATGSATVAVTVSNMNNVAGYGSEGGGATNVASISTHESYSDITPLIEFITLLSNRHFGYAHFDICVTPNTTYNTFWYVRLYDGTGGAISSDCMIVIPASSSIYTFSVNILLPSHSGYNDTNSKCKLRAKKSDSGQQTISTVSYSYQISQIGKHDHPNGDASHSNSITDVNHTNPFTDVDHQHAADNTPIEVTSYPTTVKVLVNTHEVKTDAGGSEMLIDCGDVTSYLIDGENTIEVQSTGASSAGNVEVIGNYLAFGE